MSADTIAAVATPAGRGAVGIVRLSGPAAATIAAAMSGPLPSPQTAGLRTIRDAAAMPLDDALVLFFPGPHSFTGEDVVEIQAHGAPVVLEAIVDAACAGGAPGRANSPSAPFSTIASISPRPKRSRTWWMPPASGPRVPRVPVWAVHSRGRWRRWLSVC
ncbi:hypothetical protein [Algiphilus sp.]|uniref:hypothetical protein n=1 Tax=Algiphilus sp. TaxID=1872431 RepID=UPI003C43D9C7